ncbi:MFS transporter [Embleya sp. NPDC020886]|uniref:MFS transporter n=1 Tax=Embleya sp. NPDC020886 TaxID=3363980 RepID=UPI0037B7B807
MRERRGEFVGLWTAYALSNLADGLVVITLPLIALTLTSEPGLVAGVTWAQTMPYVLCTLAVGVLVDRVERGRLVRVAHLLRVAALGLLALALAGDVAPLAMIYTMAFLLGTAELVGDLASSAMLPAVVPKDRLGAANSRMESTRSALNEFVGPPLGGLLVAAGTVTAVLGTAGVYLAAAGALLLLVRGRYAPRPAIPRPATPRPQPSPPDRASWRAELTEGLTFLRRHPLLRNLAVMVCVMAGAWSAWSAVLVLYAVAPGPMGLSGAEYGLLLTTLALGGVLGSLAAGWVQRTLGARDTLVVDVITSVLMLGAPALTDRVWIIGITTFVGGFGSGLWNVTVVTLRHRLIPDELLGRVSSAARLIGWGGMPVGAVLAGVLAQTSGPRVVFALAAAACALLFLPFVRVIREDTIRAAVEAVVEGGADGAVRGGMDGAGARELPHVPPQDQDRPEQAPPVDPPTTIDMPGLLAEHLWNTSDDAIRDALNAAWNIRRGHGCSLRVTAPITLHRAALRQCAVLLGDGSTAAVRKAHRTYADRIAAAEQPS